MDDKTISKLDQRLEILEKRLEELTSFRRNFLLSMIKGFGSVLGATILTAVLFALVTRLLQAFNGDGLIKELLRTFSK